ncbi:hypothetical protein WMY93_028468 [Mugilogobius chulae]|uniref:Secreted protein n=1 Tax=Mugilogobius chulae TaxID=88201 RepID=A0AAW0MZF6_9GOBI
MSVPTSFLLPQLYACAGAEATGPKVTRPTGNVPTLPISQHAHVRGSQRESAETLEREDRGRDRMSSTRGVQISCVSPGPALKQEIQRLHRLKRNQKNRASNRRKSS